MILILMVLIDRRGKKNINRLKKQTNKQTLNGSKNEIYSRLTKNIVMYIV